MREARPLPPSALCRRCDPASFAFGTTADLARRAGHHRPGARGGGGPLRDRHPPLRLQPLRPRHLGMGKHGFVRAFLERRAAAEKAPSDWCLRPRLRRPAAAPRAAPPAGARPAARARTCSGWWRSCAPPSPPCSRARTTARGRSSSRPSSPLQSEKAFGGLEERARARGVAIVKTPAGVGMAPLRDGEVIEPEEFQQLPAPEQERMKAEMVAVQQELQDALGRCPAGGAAPPRGDAPAGPAGHRLRHLPPRRRGARRTGRTCRRCSSTSPTWRRTSWTTPRTSCRRPRGRAR